MHTPLERTAHKTANEFSWVLLFRGIFIILFGLTAILWPGITLLTLSIVFAIYILASGVAGTILGISEVGRSRDWALHLLLGVIEVGVGVYALAHPDLSLSALILLIGLLFMARGVFEIVQSFATKWFSMKSRTLYGVAGGLAIISGIIILRYPVSGSLAFVWVLGVYALMAGAILIATSLEVRSLLDDSN